MVRIGVIGGGINSAVGRAHLSALNLDANWKVVSGFFSRDKDVNYLSGQAWRTELLYDSFESFICEDNQQIDAVLVLTPTPSHYEIVQSLLNRDLNIICEKSLTTSNQKARLISDLAVRNSLKLFVTFNYTGYPMVREIRNRIIEGFYGKIHTISIQMPQEGFAVVDETGKSKKIQNWRRSDYEIPTVSLDLGVHINNLAHFLLGDQQKRVVSLENHFGRIENTIDSVHYICEFTSGVVGNFWFGKSYLGIRNGLSLSVFGDQGSAKWTQLTPDQYWESDSMGRTRHVDLGEVGLTVANKDRYMRFKAGHPTGFIEAFANLYKDIEMSLLNQTGENHSAYVFTALDAAKGLKELEAVHLSARIGKWVDI